MRSFIILLCALLASCKTQHFEEITLTSPTMVHIEPDSRAIEQLNQKWGDEDFQVIIDDVMWYHSELMIHVDSLAMDQITTDTQHLKLIGGGQQWQINMDTTDVKWRYIYFDGKNFVEKDAISMLAYLTENN